MEIKDAYYKALEFLKLELLGQEPAKNEIDRENMCLEIRMMMRHVLKIDNNEFWRGFLGLADIAIDYDSRLLPLLKKRVAHMPLNKVGVAEFCDLLFEISQSVLAPRLCSEKLVELSKELLSAQKDRGLRILELGVGSGCNIIVLAKMFPKHTFVGVDICPEVLEVATRNAELHNVTNIEWLKSNWWESINGKFDLIISNPPYIKTADISTLAKEVRDYDPLLALDGGVDGLECYGAILHKAPLFLNTCNELSAIILEIGQGQLPEIKSIATNEGLVISEIVKDHQGIDRVIVCYLK